jgi:hypothetical protein
VLGKFATGPFAARRTFRTHYLAGREHLLEAAQVVLRPDGVLVVIDNDREWGESARLLEASPWAAPQSHAAVTDAWRAQRGASLTEVGSSWQFSSRADLEAALRLEFAPGLAAVWLADHPDALGLTYGYVLFAVSRPS